MKDAVEAVKDSLNLNQNLWGLVVAMTALGFGEFYKLGALRLLAFITACGMMTSLAVTTIAYTKDYCRKKNRNVPG